MSSLVDWLQCGVVSSDAASKLTPQGEKFKDNNIVFVSALVNESRQTCGICTHLCHSTGMRVKTDSRYWSSQGYKTLLPRNSHTSLQKQPHSSLETVTLLPRNSHTPPQNQLHSSQETATRIISEAMELEFLNQQFKPPELGLGSLRFRYCPQNTLMGSLDRRR